jgi:hypothetical protein
MVKVGAHESNSDDWGSWLAESYSTKHIEMVRNGLSYLKKKIKTVFKTAGS